MRQLQTLITTIFIFLSTLISAQNGKIVSDAFNRPAFAYRSAENPYYWKNRKPYDGYWQQDVEYKISAEIDETTNIISGTVRLTYYNNSPDALPFVYFHLYQEAFLPGGYVEDLYKVNDVKPTFGKYESQGLGTEVENITITNRNGFPVSETATLIQDFSVLKAELKYPVAAGGSITFEIPFKTYFDNEGSLRRRMKEFSSGEFMHYDGVHWYPRICVYDMKFGWDTEQHLGKEFYGDYGSYEVDLTFASNYIVEATGYLLNANEVMPNSLREKLNIKNFAGKAWNEPASVIIPYVQGDKKTWRYYAENVHDFAFTADPSYRIGETMTVINGKQVRCIALAQEGHAAFWQNAADYTAKVIHVYSNDFGDYIWPKIIVADARDGMEYPMLTLDGGYDPSYRDLFAHEIGHMWFFGMVGNNETYRAALDEGFSQFLTAWSYMKIDGDVRIEFEDKSNYKNTYRKPDEIIMSEVYSAYLQDAVRANDMPLNTHSDMFNSALAHGGGYRHVYFKTAVMLYNLEYVLGDDLFEAAMKHYFEQWKLCHPYFEDFRNSIINYTHVDLNWFFDAWLETTKNIDYGISEVRKNPEFSLDGQPLLHYDVLFKRKGMQMPVDFQVVLENGDTLNYYIPNTWFNKYEGQKNISEGRLDRTYFENVIVLPKWYGFDKLESEYVAHVIVPAKIKQITIDPSNRLADINKLDNTWKCSIDYEFDSQIRNTANWNQYALKWRPEIWGNAYDGLKVGLHFNGNYFNYKHMFEFTAWFNTGILQSDYYHPLNSSGDDITDDFDPFSFHLSYKTATDNFLPRSNFLFDTKYLDGVFGFKIGEEIFLDRDFRNKITFYFNDFQIVKNQYLLYGDLIDEAKNNSFNLEYEHKYNYFKGNGKFTLGFRSNDLLSDYDFSRVQVEAINNTALGKFDLKTRYFLQWGSGSSIPFASSLMLAGANAEELLDSKFTRSRGFVPNEWTTFGNITNHFQMGGGLNLRGYSGYLVAEENEDGTIYLAYSGVSGTSANIELEFDRLFNFKIIKFIKMDPYVFADGGILSVDEDFKQLSSFRMDAGIGTAFTWSWFGPLETVKPITLRIDFPVWLSNAPFEESENFKFRYVIGLNRCF